MSDQLCGIPLIDRAFGYNKRIAVRHRNAAISYENLLERSGHIAKNLLGGANDLQEARIAFLAAPGIEYVCIQWGIWRAGGIAVPLCEKHPPASMEYVLKDTAASALIYTPEFQETLQVFKGSGLARLINVETLLKNEESNRNNGIATTEAVEKSMPDLPKLNQGRRAMILYTSGTTGAPKGVVTTHANIHTQITALTTSWQWEADDHVLNVLPLHHVHGIINMLSCALYSGACCEFLPRFDPHEVYEVFLKGAVNVFMAVPTIYFKLIAHYQTLDPNTRAELSHRLKKFRLMVSGSAALPVSVLEQWREISGHTLLERYGMTEMGMAISNPYKGQRRPGFIGQPLSGVTVRLVDESNELVAEAESGEIQVKGDNVFSEYWGKPEETQKTFTPDGWFKTGDIAVFEEGSYRILGRNSVDIIKSGGYKISALEIEEVLRKHPHVRDCAVVGLPDLEWGEIIGAGIVSEGDDPSPDVLKAWLKPRLAAYKIPRAFLMLEAIPRNVLGKVTKNELKKLFETSK